MPQSVPSPLGILLLVLFVFGCQTPLTVKKIQAKNPWAKNSAKTPVKVVDLWNSYAQTTESGEVVRGMAGRVHFYDNARKNRSVKVDGDLTVYVFDSNETDPTHTKPLKIFQFKAETLDKHHSFQKSLGHSYFFFLPIDEMGGEEKPLCILTRFDDRLEKDTFVMTPSVHTMLAGRKPQQPTEPSIREFLESQSHLAEANQNIAIGSDSVIQQVGYVTEKQNVEPEKTRVSTIPLSDGMTKRLIEAKTPAPL